MTRTCSAGAIAALLLVVSSPLVPAQQGELQIEIQNLPDETLLTGEESEIDVEGWASVFGGLKHLDLFLILDASRSLLRTDPDDYRIKGATALVHALPTKSDIQIGVVAFDSDAWVVSPLTADRQAILDKLQTIGRDGGTNLHDGIDFAVRGFEGRARPDAARIALLFTDGKSDRNKAILAAQEAAAHNVVIHSLLLLDRDKSELLLQTIAQTTRGSFLYVDDPQKLPQAFLDLRTTGVDRVELRVDDGAPIGTDLVAGTFSGRVPLHPGHNVITATATDIEGRAADDSVRVTVTGPLRVAIASPIDGTLYTRREDSADVRVNASVFREPTDRLRQDFPTLGVDSVVLGVRDSPPHPAEFADGAFLGTVPLELHGNRITAVAASFDGRTAQAFVDVNVRPPGCGELRVAAERDGVPAISLHDRGIEVVFDASGSMWGRIDGTPKITIAKETVREVLTGFPADILVALRVYGHQYPREQRNCTDSELLIPLGRGKADEIRRAIDAFKPRGQTPLAYSIEQAPSDFGDFEGERAVVLITDGIESCDGDPVAATRGFQEPDRLRPVHVIYFGAADSSAEQREAFADLRRVADTTGGKFIAAGDGGALRRALAETTGTGFTIWRDARRVAEGTLGIEQTFQLPAGEYVLRLGSEPPQAFPLTVAAEESLDLTLVREGDDVFTRDSRRPASYVLCEPVTGP